MKERARRINWLLLLSAAGISLWLMLAWAVEDPAHKPPSLGRLLMRTQDIPALIIGCGLLAIGAVGWRLAPKESARWAGKGSLIFGISLISAIIAWTGRYWLMRDYSLSRDEEVAEFAARSMSLGWLARPIPPEWIAYRRAIMPEFFSPFGADRYWNAAYLPLNSAFRALCGFFGDPNVAAPIMLVLGLLALWRVATRLFPERTDAVAVTMLMALTSAQLLVTAMTPYAMTAHFALNLLWLALVQRGGRIGHAGAALVTLALVGVHQYHYPLVFLTPFLLWFALGRRWGALAWHSAALIVAVALWAKLWPHLLIDWYGPAADVRPSAGVSDKLGSLVERLDKWRPLLHLTRFLVWNNLLLVPLALVGLWRMDWRAALRGERIELPLAIGAFGMAALAIDQGYGWGYRYLHGFEGSFALLAAFGFTRLRRADMRPIWTASLVAMATGSFLAARAHHLVSGYAAAHRQMMGINADVVLLDWRGGFFATDLGRGDQGEPLGRPVIMSMQYLGEAGIDALCNRHSVVIYDRSAFLRAGVIRAGWRNSRIDTLRERMAQRGCGRLFVP
jgi:hypothetical protein